MGAADRSSHIVDSTGPRKFDELMNGEERGIPVIDRSIDYKEFLDDFLRPLKPCLITGLTQDWPAAREWVTKDSSSDDLSPDYETLKTTFGQYTGCITFCGQKDRNEETIQKEMTVAEFIDSISSSKSEKRYLKDFHFMRVNPSLPKPYTVPKFFEGITFITIKAYLDDWFNNFAFANDRDDFRFLYLGEDGSFTPLHHDVNMSHSWSTSLCGISS